MASTSAAIGDQQLPRGEEGAARLLGRDVDVAKQRAGGGRRVLRRRPSLPRGIGQRGPRDAVVAAERGEEAREREPAPRATPYAAIPRVGADEPSAAIAQDGRPGCGAATGKPVSRNRGGGGPPHWLIVPGRIGQRRGA